MKLLIIAGVLGALLDILLHVLQLVDIPALRNLAKRKAAAWITLASAALIAVSLIVQFNAGTFVMCLFIAGLAMFSIITGKEMEHD